MLGWGACPSLRGVLRCPTLLLGVGCMLEYKGVLRCPTPLLGVGAYPTPAGHDNMHSRMACAHPKMGPSMLLGPIHLCLVWAQAVMLEPMLYEPHYNL